MKITETEISKIIPYARNPRVNVDAISKVASSIKEFGFRQSVVVDHDCVVIAGHTRLEASKLLGLKKVPVHVAEGLTPQQVKAYRIADNRVAQDSDWDMELLKLELEEIEALNTTGFDEDELAAILTEVTEGLTDPDDAPEVPEQAFTVPGDLIELGHHRLVVGDSTNSEHVDLSLGGIAPLLMVTDPPYGVNYDDSWRVNRGLSDVSSLMPVTNDHTEDWTDAWTLFPR